MTKYGKDTRDFDGGAVQGDDTATAGVVIPAPSHCDQPAQGAIDGCVCGHSRGDHSNSGVCCAEDLSASFNVCDCQAFMPKGATGDSDKGRPYGVEYLHDEGSPLWSVQVRNADGFVAYISAGHRSENGARAAAVDWLRGELHHIAGSQTARDLAELRLSEQSAAARGRVS